MSYTDQRTLRHTLAARLVVGLRGTIVQLAERELRDTQLTGEAPLLSPAPRGARLARLPARPKHLASRGRPDGWGVARGGCAHVGEPDAAPALEVPLT
ncbi:hypothetical protein [Streptomyces sp. NPDC055189]